MSRKIVVGNFIQKVLHIMNFNNDNFTPFSIIKVSLTFLFLHIITIGLWGHLIHHITTLNGNPFDFAFCANDLAGILSSYLAVYMQLQYFIHSKRIKILLEEMGDFGSYEIPENYAENMDFFNRRSKYFVVFIHLCHYAAWFLTLLQKCEPGDQSHCGMIITAYLPFDIFYTPRRQIFSLLQAITGFHSAIAAISIALIFVCMIYSLTLQINHLRVMLMRIQFLKTKDARKKQLNDCIKYHCRILDLKNKCSFYSSKILFVLVFMVSIILSFTGYTLIVLNKEFVIMLHMSVYIICVSALCACGERLIDENNMLFFTIYDAIPWDGDLSIAKDMSMMMMIAKSEISISIGYGSIGHVRLMMIYKSTYSFLTLMMDA